MKIKIKGYLRKSISPNYSSFVAQLCISMWCLIYMLLYALLMSKQRKITLQIFIQLPSSRENAITHVSATSGYEE